MPAMTNLTQTHNERRSATKRLAVLLWVPDHWQFYGVWGWNRQAYSVSSAQGTEYWVPIRRCRKAWES